MNSKPVSKIEWNPAAEPPNDDRVVLVQNLAWKTLRCNIGWRDRSGQWRTLDAMKIQPPPTMWAELPEAFA